MKYVALLRGINVGGNCKVDMKQLKAVFEEAGMSDVRTYINSGNVIFTSGKTTQTLTPILETAIEKHFKLSIRVLLRSEGELKATVKALPDSWQNNAEMKCDVLFLFPENDSAKVLDVLEPNPSIEDLRYVPGAVLWRIDRPHVTKSKILKMVGTPTYKQMTVRNCNTVRKIYERMLAD